MNAVLLGRIFMGVIVALLVGIGFGFVQITTMLDQQVTETDHIRIDRELANLEIDKLKKLQTELEKQQDVVKRASEIVATADAYQYQDQIVSDIGSYARQNGLTISGFDFSVAAGATPAPAAGSTSPVAPKPGGTKTSATITLKSPLPYKNFIKFISQLETNLTKIQITTITLNPDAKDPQLIINPVVGIEVFIKS